MDENQIEIRAVIKFLFQKGYDNVKTLSEIQSIYGEGCMSLRNIQKRRQQFEAGNYSIFDKPRDGRPQITQYDNQILDLLQEDPFLKTKEIAEHFQIDKKTVKAILEDHLQYHKVNFKWVPHQLTASLRAERVRVATELLKFLKKASPSTLQSVYTEDETWIYYENPRTSMWILNGSTPPTVSRRNIGAKKCMIAVFWSRLGIASITMLPKGQKFNRDFFLNNVFRDFEALTPRYKKFVHFDNARPHLIDQYLDEKKIKRLPHPPYSPDLAPSDFFLFGYLKMKLEGCVFEDEEDLFMKVKNILYSIPSQYFIDAYTNWIERLYEVIEREGEYL